MLECLETGIGRAGFYVRLIRAFGAAKADICGLVGFRYSFYRGRDCPDSLYRLTAVLIQGSSICYLDE